MQGPPTKYIGRHTTISHLTPSEWNKIPYLKDNEGLLPPFVIAAGDARRVSKAPEILNLEDIVLLHKKGEELLGPKGKGRVDIIIGRYVHNDKSIPLLIVETQMGMPATEIILREVLTHCTTKYNLPKSHIKTDGIYIIRTGTACGINTEDGSGEKIEVGNIVNALFSIGWSGTLLESIAGLDYSSPKVIEIFRQKWVESGHLFTKDDKYPMAKLSPVSIKAIDKAAKEIDVKAFSGGNFSKDSLYAENDMDAFLELRRKYNILSSEMEQLAISKLASDFQSLGQNVYTGLVSGIIGVLPDSSFATDDKHEKKIKEVEKASLAVSALALWKVVYG